MMPLVVASVTLCICLQINPFWGVPYPQSSPERLKLPVKHRDYFVPTPSHSNNAIYFTDMKTKNASAIHTYIDTHYYRFLHYLWQLSIAEKLPTRKLKWLEFGENTCTVIKTCLKTCHEILQYFDSSHRLHHLYNLWIINKTQITEDHVSKVVRLGFFCPQRYF